MSETAPPPETPLSRNMRAVAAKGHPRAADLREKADAHDKAVADWNDDGRDKDIARRMLGAWARARRLYYDCTGAPLV